MLFVYPALFHKEEKEYWVEFPDLPGCHTYGAGISEAVPSAQEALSGYLMTLLVDGKDIPAASDMEGLKADDGFASLVACDLDQYKNSQAVKKTLSIPKWLNDRALAMGVNFSQVLQEALIAKTVK